MVNGNRARLRKKETEEKLQRQVKDDVGRYARYIDSARNVWISDVRRVISNAMEAFRWDGGDF